MNKVLIRLFFAIAIILVPGSRGASAKTEFILFNTIESFSEEYKFESLSSFFISGEELYIADNAGKRIYIFGIDGTPIFQFGKEKGLGRPIDLFVFEDRIYVSQQGKNTIEIFNIRGDRIGKIDPPPDGFMPDRMALMEDGGFLAVDKSTLKIYIFDKHGKYLYNFGGRDVFRSMGGIATKGDKIYVTVMDSHPLIRVFDTKGKYLTGFGEIGDSKELFSMPTGIKVDDQGAIWVVDAFRHTVAEFNQNGKRLDAFGGFGTLYYPISVDFKGDLFFVLDNDKRRISVFKREE